MSGALVFGLADMSAHLIDIVIMTMSFEITIGMEGAKETAEAIARAVVAEAVAKAVAKAVEIGVEHASCPEVLLTAINNTITAL